MVICNERWRRKAKSVLYSIALALMTISGEGTAETIFHPDTNAHGLPSCTFQGAISPREVTALQRALAEGCKTVYLNSPGGDVDAALTMGRAIRRSEAVVVVPSPGKCASACVFLYAGGVIRAPYSRIEIHRPYNTEKGSYSADLASFRLMAARVRAYLREVNVDEALFSRMMRIAPEDVVALTLDELEELGLGQTDAVYQHHLDKKEAARRGMSIQRFLEAKKRLKVECGDPNKAMQPADAARVFACWDKQLSARS